MKMIYTITFIKYRIFILLLKINKKLKSILLFTKNFVNDYENIN